ncbi:hypothetical protein Q4595_15930 [Wenyingzhuangia sp. 1_MG-2023]|nr:hypothetical protein [Wenyingzhuangia sp. 1_MG-2023]
MSCKLISNQKIFVFEEQKSKLSLINKDEVESTQIKVDNCLIKDNSLKCDYMHLAKDIEFYIELKGQDINHAVKQLKSTFKQLSSNSKKSKKISYIICARTPLSATQILKLKREFKKDYNSKLEVKSSPFKSIY